jgi:hypothetical protein
MTPAVVARSGAPAGLSHDSERESRTVGPIRSFEGSFADAGALVTATISFVRVVTRAARRPRCAAAA